MANVIDSLNFDGTTEGIFTLPYGTCATAAATVAKVATATNFVLETGARIAIKFTYANSAASPTLNVNSSGAKAIYWHGAALASSQYWQAGAILDFVYNGTQWELIGIAKDNNTTYSAAGSALGLVKTGGDVTISNGIITVKDDSHTHTIANVTNLQSSLDGKQATITGGASTITGSNLTANRALISNGSGKVAVSAVTSTELGYLDGVTSNVQTQLDGLTSNAMPKSGGTFTGNVVANNTNRAGRYIRGNEVRNSAGTTQVSTNSIVFVRK